MVLQHVSKLVTKIFGSRNERLVKTYMRRVELVNTLEPETARLSDAQLRGKTAEFRDRLSNGADMDTIMPEALAVAREAMDRAVGMRNIFNPEHGFDREQLPQSLRAEYDRIASEVAQREPAEVLGGEPAPAYLQQEVPIEIYQAVRELYPKSRPPFRCRPFDVQLVGGMVLSEGKIAEMKTGEGKTIVAPLACYLACLEDLQCHVVTTNDYLVQRDRDWVFPFYYWLGLTVGAIHPMHMQHPQLKAQAYQCNVVYGTNSELGFDYLRDNMKLSVQEQVQKRRDFVIVDEVDSILVDEARTPLIISGPAHDDAPRYELADQIARHLMQKQQQWDAADNRVRNCQVRISGLEGDIRNTRDKDKVPQMRKDLDRLRDEELPRLEAERDQHIQYFEVERDKKAAHLTHEGVAEAQKVANVGSFYVGNNIDMPHLLENALRAHAVYQRDKDYVVQDGQVVIVDEFTGRLMVGRQWSDGLHQAVEAKERVKVKQETQTLATVTIQNFFKLYKRLAGMTGTAMTEATEFDDIYKLDVVAIPTNVPVIRNDRDDLIYLSEKDKWNAILDEIKRMHDVGRPVLVGTTSVQKSEMLSEMLTKRHAIAHEVLNAKQHEREASVVESAGALGSVMIATNMAGRGTDIKLRPVERAELVEHWQRRNLLPKAAKPEMDDQALRALNIRHLASVHLGVSAREAEGRDVEQLHLQLLRHWVSEYGGQVLWLNSRWWYAHQWFATPAWHDPAKIANLDKDQCLAVLDALPEFLFHRLQIWEHVERMGGLHIVGTERHESRRIDNQLRGRAGRQGDRGSSRFFISLEDDLMKHFANKAVLGLLSRLGMKEGDAIEARMVTRSVERAQRKVEERNFQIRKNLLEYDKVMEFQRNAFYGVRQSVLEGRDIQQIIFDYIGQAVDDAVAAYLDRDYVPTQIAEWARAELDISIEPMRLRGETDAASVEVILREIARGEVQQQVETSLGEYMAADQSPEEWDLRGLSSWAMSRFNVSLSQNKLRRMNIDEVRDTLVEAAIEQVDNRELAGFARYLEPLYAQKQLSDWTKRKFGIEIEPERFDPDQPGAAADLILEQARKAYHEREIRYPVRFTIKFAYALSQQDPRWAESLSQWVKRRYELELAPEDIQQTEPQALYDRLCAEAAAWADNGKLDALVKRRLEGDEQDAQSLSTWVRERFGQVVEPDEFEQLDPQQRHELLVSKGRQMLRAELTQLERSVLLQILDMAWKDHLYAMDQLKDAVSLQSFAEKDPRIEYQRQGSDLFTQMQATVRDRVTDHIFFAELTPEVKVRDVYGQQQARHDEAQSAMSQARQPQPAAQASESQRADMEAADRAGGDREPAYASRKQRRAAEARQRRDTGPKYKDRKKRKR